MKFFSQKQLSDPCDGDSFIEMFMAINDQQKRGPCDNRLFSKAFLKRFMVLYLVGRSRMRGRKKST